jgi:hypothetical protein
VRSTFNLHAQHVVVKVSLSKTVVLSVGLGRGFCVETAHLDKSSRLLSIGSTYILEVFAECVRVIENGVAICHSTTSQRMYRLVQ